MHLKRKFWNPSNNISHRFLVPESAVLAVY